MVNPRDLATSHREQAVKISPVDIDKQIGEILDEPANSLVEEASQLERAHAVLHRALQDNR